MRVCVALGAWWLLLTLACWVVTGSQWTSTAASEATFWWQLRQQALYLSGVWSIGMMSLAMALSLRQRWMEMPLGGMDQVYRLHKWAGITAALFALLHWGAKESSGLIKDIWGLAGRPARDAVPAWAADWRGWGKDLGEWAFYALLLMVVVTLWQRVLPYRPWRKLHKAMPVLYVALAFHTVVLLPVQMWRLPMGGWMAVLLTIGCAATVWSLTGRIGHGRNSYVAQVHAVQQLGEEPGNDPLEVICALPGNWKGHQPGQFVFVGFDALEGSHPFTIASAPGSCGRTEDGGELLRLVIKPLGDYTRTLHAALRVGQAVFIEGPYGHFDGQGSAARQQVWVAGGVGITPFLSMLEARQPGREAGLKEGLHAVNLHYCTRNAATDPVLPRLRSLCANAQPSVWLQVHDAAQGQYLQPEDLSPHGASMDLWFCGPSGLGKALSRSASHQPGWRMHQEAFQMR